MEELGKLEDVDAAIVDIRNDMVDGTLITHAVIATEFTKPSE